MFQPRPVHGRIPVWVIGAWFAPRSMRRAAGRDGVLPVRREDGFDPLGPDELREVRAWVSEQRGGEPFELVVEGVLPSDPAQARGPRGRARGRRRHLVDPLGLGLRHRDPGRACWTGSGSVPSRRE